MTDSTTLSDAQSDAQITARNHAAKRVIFFTVFLDLLGFGIIIPQLGVYAAQYGASPFVVGVLAATYSAMGFLFTPFWGRLSDRIGRRPVLLISIFGTALGYILFAFSHSLVLLFAARVVDGITGGNISVAQAYLSDVTPPAERAKTFGMFGAIFGIGFAIGPAVGALISYLPGAWGGNLGLGLITAALSFINWAMALKRLPETLPPAVREENNRLANGRRVQIINISGFQRAFRLPAMGIILWISLFATVAFATLQGTYTLFLITRYIRPDVQTYISQNTDSAVAEARRDTADSGATAGLSGGESTVELSSTDEPYPKSMGGDWNLNRAAPQGWTWTRVEKELVRPRATRMAAWIFAAIGLTALVVQGGLVGKLKKHFSEVNLVIAGTLMMALGLIIVPIPKNVALEFPVMMLLAFGNSISTPILTALVSELAPENERGEIMGVFQSVANLGRIIGPIVGGSLFLRFSPGMPYFAGAAIMMLSFFMALKLRAVCPNGDCSPAPV